MIPPVRIRCRSQAPEAPPRFARPRLLGGLNELGGALGDLGTFLPHVIAAITVIGMAPSGVLVGFGLFYLAAGLVFGVPMGVQPMKAASAAVLVQHLSPAEVAAAGLVLGGFFFLLAVTGLITRIARRIPAAVTAGIQLGLGLSLAFLGLRLLSDQLWLALAVAAVMVPLLRSRRFPAAVAGLVVGVCLAAVTGQLPSLGGLSPGLHLPRPVWPTWSDTVRATELAVIPQIPLTLTNAILVTVAITHRYFPREIHHVTERSLALSMGIGNLLTAPFGGYPMCHGAGGIAGHYRFGARSATAPAIIGLGFLALGLLLGDDAVLVMRLIPPAVVGALLFFSGLELARAADPLRLRGRTAVVVVFVAAVGLAIDIALAFVLGLALAWMLERGRRVTPESGAPSGS